MSPKYTCPCCGFIVFAERQNYEICPICFWEDDAVQAADPWFAGGANKPSLAEAQRIYEAIGAMEARFVPDVRAPLPSDRRDPAWRPLSERDKQYATTPIAIESCAEARPSYAYWLRAPQNEP